MAEFGDDPTSLMAGMKAMRTFAGNEAKNLHLVKVKDERILIFEYLLDGKYAPFAIPINQDTNEDSQPLDYRQTIKYLKKISDLDYDQTVLKKVANSNQLDTKYLIWIGVFVIVMFIVIRFTNHRLKNNTPDKH